METQNIALLDIGALIYIITGLLFVYAAYFFFVRKDGMLRRALIGLFSMIGIGVLSRGIWLFLELSHRVETNAIVSLISIGAVFVGIVGFIMTIIYMDKKQ